MGRHRTGADYCDEHRFVQAITVIRGGGGSNGANGLVSVTCENLTKFSVHHAEVWSQTTFLLCVIAWKISDHMLVLCQKLHILTYNRHFFILWRLLVSHFSNWVVETGAVLVPPFYMVQWGRQVSPKAGPINRKKIFVGHMYKYAVFDISLKPTYPNH